ncbi:phosphotransferase family protein [Colletotrichum incanum]|uniref:Phosphotransferase family protein n=1 Tax=Colletotrichum incanum TaxID=1573173 RepID=A0A162PXB3_COLIC|nr:phosphotransferase family protein [Colletotrichum incanum]
MSTANNSTPIIGLDGPSAPGRMTIFSESSFFKEKRAPTLPLTAEVRARNEESGNIRATSFNRPPPVTFLSLGLLVRYGGNTKIIVHKRLPGKVPVPEIFGWTEDDGQRFIYMASIEGITF